MAWNRYGRDYRGRGGYGSPYGYDDWSQSVGGYHNYDRGWAANVPRGYHREYHVLPRWGQGYGRDFGHGPGYDAGYRMRPERGGGFRGWRGGFAHDRAGYDVRRGYGMERYDRGFRW